MCHTLLSMLPMIAYLIVCGTVAILAGVWACNRLEANDDYGLFGSDPFTDGFLERSPENPNPMRDDVGE